MNIEEMRKKLEEHMKLPFPSMEGLDLGPELAVLDGDIVGEMQTIISGGKSDFEYIESYRETIKEIRTEAEHKKLADVIVYLKSLARMINS